MDIKTKDVLSNIIVEKESTDKLQIVLGNIYYPTFDIFLNSLEFGNNLKCPHFSIDIDGEIYKHFDIEYYSRFLDTDYDENVITIGLINLGYIFKRAKNYYDIYNNRYEGEVYKKKWKNSEYWQPYTDKQYQSTIDLCLYLLEETKINKSVIPINIYKQDIINFKGISYRSNHDIKHYDLNPSWDFKKFKKSIENGK